MKPKLIIAGLIVVIVGAWAFTSFTNSMTSYVSFGEAQTRPQRVQVMGAIDHDKVVWDVEKKLLTFPITDTAGATMLVRYTGTMPGNFGQATHAVCVGRFNNQAFEAEQLLIKCPSKYQGES
jgi:cytochrome c-type biogenesis protein CcmE